MHLPPIPPWRVHSKAVFSVVVEFLLIIALIVCAGFSLVLVLLCQKKPYVPRVLIIHSEKEGETISSLSPFVVHKTIMSIAGEPKRIKNLRSGDLLIQCAKESHEKSLLQMKTFCGLKCSVTPHSSLNTSKGITRCPALSRVTSDNIKEGMIEQGVTDVRRITVRRDGVIKLTNTYLAHITYLHLLK